MYISEPKLEIQDQNRWYLPPEVIINHQSHDQAEDIWAVGCIMGELFENQPIFPGINEIDQLFKIIKYIGDLTDQQKQMIQQNPQIQGIDFNNIEKYNLEEKLSGQITENAWKFLKSTLKMDPYQRPTIQECIDNEYFDEIRNLYVEWL